MEERSRGVDITAISIHAADLSVRLEIPYLYMARYKINILYFKAKIKFEEAKSTTSGFA